MKDWQSVNHGLVKDAAVRVQPDAIFFSYVFDLCINISYKVVNNFHINISKIIVVKLKEVTYRTRRYTRLTRRMQHVPKTIHFGVTQRKLKMYSIPRRTTKNMLFAYRF